MMDKKTIKDTGLLELYVLGELDAKQEQEIKTFLASDQELAKHVSEIEKSFEKMAFENAIDPSETLKETLLSQINSQNDDVVQLAKRSSNRWYLGIAAAIAGFLLISTYMLYSELNTTKTELQTVSNEKEQLSKEFGIMQTEYDEMRKWYAIISNPEAEQYVFRGNALSPKARLVSYVNHKDKQVIVSTYQLPELDKDHDYQMWADVEGEMINMGIISKENPMLAMTYIDHAESLNITIEPKGGSAHPTVSRLISNVYL